MRKPFWTLLKIILITLPLLVCLMIFIYANRHVVRILPSHEYYSLGYWPSSNEQTVINSFVAEPDLVTLTYTRNCENSYAGIGVTLAKDFPLRDLSGYGALRLKITTDGAKKLKIIVTTFEPGITERMDKGFTHLRQKEVLTEVNKKHNRITIPLRNFEDPGEWLNEYAGRQGLEESPFRYAYTLQILFDGNNSAGQSNQVVLTEVSFYSLPPLFWLLLFILVMVYYLFYTTTLIFLHINKRRQKQNQKNILTSYKKINKETYREKDTEKMSRYINSNYYDPSISQDTIVAATGLSRKRITALCQQEYNMTLKECINWLRLTEAKRLLIESDLGITEIAFTLGYSSSSYFGALFKNQEEMSPKEFRKKYRHPHEH